MNLDTINVINITLINNKMESDFSGIKPINLRTNADVFKCID